MIPVKADLRTAVEPVLASRSFRRAEQLKRLLSYLADQANAGRADAVTEYELGVEALGRPASFAPDTDSSVRTRVHALRQKLDEYYRDEAPAAEWRLRIPKGTYQLELTAAAAEPLAPAQAPSPLRRWRWALILTAAALAAFVIGRPRNEIGQLWRPLLNSPLPVAIVVGQPVHVWVRDAGPSPDSKLYPHFPDAVPDSEPFRRYLRQRLPQPHRLVLHPSPNASLWGDAAGAAAASRFLAFRGIASELFPESTLKGEAALRGRALVVFGRPEFSPAVNRYLALAGGYRVGMHDGEYAIHQPGGRAFFNTAPPNEVNHGLITVLEEAGHPVFVFSGITSDGSAAGLDFFTNEESLRALRRRMGVDQWPAAFQVVVRTVSSSGYSMGAAYEAHTILRSAP